MDAKPRPPDDADTAPAAPPRRRFFADAGAVALGTAMLPVGALAQQPAAAATAASSGAGGAPGSREAYLFLNAEEAAFIEAAVQRLIPPDELGPGALEAGVPTYIDRQLQGAWGAGERLYRSGPWQPGTPSQGYQLPFTPAELFRTALRAVRADIERSGNPPFEAADGRWQDLYLTELQAGRRQLETIPSQLFFESLWGLTLEGYFGDPIYGGNRDMASWRMIGFPGAYGAYYDLVDQHGVAFTAPPRSIADGPSRTHTMQVHVHLPQRARGRGAEPAAARQGALRWPPPNCRPPTW